MSKEYRARALTVIHASFSGGMVFGMLATPQLVLACGWPGALKGFTLLGLAWAVSSQYMPVSVPHRSIRKLSSASTSH